MYLSLIVLIPLSGLFLKTATISWHRFWETVSDPRAIASYRLTFGAAFAGALVNAVFGFVVAWTLVRYRFRGRRLLDAVVDLPFALPTAVSGIALTALYSPNGWIGRLLAPLRNQGRLLAAGRGHRAHVHRPAVRGAHAAAGHRGSGCRHGRSGPDAGRQPLSDLPPGDLSVPCCRPR